MSKPTMHYNLLSGPARFALMVAREIGLDINTKQIELLSGQQRTEEFMKLNPTSTVPVLVDGEVTVFDSNAIAIYMVEKYAKNDSLYPKDLVLRTKVNEVLFYVASAMFPRILNFFFPVIFLGEKEVSQTKIDAIVKGYHCIEKFLESSKYVAGNNLTLADLSLWPLIESSMQIIPVDAETFPKFNEWLDRLRQLPYYDELNKKGADPHVQAYRDFLVKNNV